MKKRIAMIVMVLSFFFVPMPSNAADSGWIVSCQYSHTNKDDPIVFPNQPGLSHSHDYVGSKTTDANSTPQTMLEGATSCLVPGDKSGYWIPTAYKNGQVIHPQGTNKNALFYYRRKGAPTGVIVQPFPLGLKMIVGNAHAQSAAENPDLGTHIIFKCGPGSGTDLPAPPSQCPNTPILSVSLQFPNCWDGQHLDSADHKSHMSYPVNNKCPATHPVVLPRIESFWRYNVGTAPFTFSFDSGPYYTVHQDFFDAWVASDLQKLVDKCLNPGFDCGTNPMVSGLLAPIVPVGPRISPFAQ